MKLAEKCGLRLTMQCKHKRNYARSLTFLSSGAEGGLRDAGWSREFSDVAQLNIDPVIVAPAEDGTVRNKTRYSCHAVLCNYCETGP